MSILDNRRATSRIRKYPNRLMQIQESYGKTIGDASVITVDPCGDITKEANGFREKLRIYQLGLSACISYGESLEKDLLVDIATLRSSLISAHALEVNTVRTTILTLENELNIIRALIVECDRRCKAIHEVRRTLQIIKEEQTLAHLVKLEKDLAEDIKRRG